MGAEDLTEHERPPHPVRVSAFSIQTHEVTNEEYRRFDPEHAFPERRDKYPVADVSWYGAAAYAAWLGGSLPTEVQWEFAARGKERREFPWGRDNDTADRADFGGDEAKPVGSHPRGATPQGVQDLGGNVSEWCRDRFGPYMPSSARAPDPLGARTGRHRVVRGGSFAFLESYLRAAYRYNYDPHDQVINLGFRVVVSRS